MKRMSVRDFRAAGYLQELNRRFLHPLGMALEVVVDDDGSERFGGVWDCRDDPEGMVYAEGELDQEFVTQIMRQLNAAASVRLGSFGWFLQPE